MKNIFLMIIIVNSSHVFGVIRGIGSKEIAGISDKLVTFHEPTSSVDRSPKPNLSNLNLGTDKVLIAKMNSFGLDRYFAFETNDDVDALVKGVQQGGGCDVSWYYVKKEDTVKVMSVEEWIQSQK